MNSRILVSCACLAALALGSTGCQTNGGGGNWDWQTGLVQYEPHVTLIARAAIINVLKGEEREKIEVVGQVATVVSSALANDGIILDPNFATEQIKKLIEANAPDIATDPGIMSIVDVAVSIAIGQVESLVSKYGPQFDQSNVTIRLIQAALAGVKGGVDALLMPGGPPPIPS